MPKPAWLAATLVFVVAPIQAEIFKCTNRDGTVLYQNFKCEVDSLGSLPSAPTLAVPKPAPAGNPIAQKPKSVTAENVADARAKSGTLRIGMTTDEVRALLGEPTEMFQDELVEGRVEIWNYGSARSVKFNVSGRVTEIQP